MRLDCPGEVVTLGDGSIACHDDQGDPVPWIVAPDFTADDLTAAEFGPYFAAGFAIVATVVLAGRAARHVLAVLKR